jgi:hypothetical protein
MSTAGKIRIMIFGPKDDGTYVVEFRTAEGEVLAISIPRSEATVIRYFQGADALRAVRAGGADQLEPRTRGTKVPAPSCGLAGTTPGEDVMARLIQELLLLTCMGGFVASVTYAVTLLH